MEITSRLICIMILVHVKNFELIDHACSYQRKLSVDGGAGALANASVVDCTSNVRSHVSFALSSWCAKGGGARLPACGVLG